LRDLQFAQEMNYPTLDIDIDRDGRAEWVDVKRGPSESGLVEVIGDLQAGDLVVRRATDEIREGAALQARTK